MCARARAERCLSSVRCLALGVAVLVSACSSDPVGTLDGLSIRGQARTLPGQDSGDDPLLVSDAGAFQEAGAGEPSPTDPPGGRSSFVMTMMNDRTRNAAWVRLAEVELAARGLAKMSFWEWNQASFTGDASTNKVPVATTRGCLRSCTVKAPLRFQRYAEARHVEGTFVTSKDASGGDVVTITWPDRTEAWSASHGSDLTTMTLTTSSAGARVGWAFGSKASLTQGLSIDEVFTSSPITGPYFSNAYDAETSEIRDQINFADWARCSGDQSLQVKSVTDPDKTKWWSSYLVGDPSVDGRKMYWNHERGVVTQAQAPGAVCISPGGGHTFALLQILDDAGRFRGWVSAEGSQHGRYRGGDIVSIAALTN